MTWTGAGPVNDVDIWLDEDAGSFGWLLVAASTLAVANAMRFVSREFAEAGDRPLLQLTYERGPVPLLPSTRVLARLSLLYRLRRPSWTALSASADA